MVHHLAIAKFLTTSFMTLLPHCEPISTKSMLTRMASTQLDRTASVKLFDRRTPCRTATPTCHTDSPTSLTQDGTVPCSQKRASTLSPNSSSTGRKSSRSHQNMACGICSSAQSSLCWWTLIGVKCEYYDKARRLTRSQGLRHRPGRHGVEQPCRGSCRQKG